MPQTYAHMHSINWTKCVILKEREKEEHEIETEMCWNGLWELEGGEIRGGYEYVSLYTCLKSPKEKNFKKN